MRIAMIGAFGLAPRMTMSARAYPLAQALAALGHEVTLIMPPWHTPERGGQSGEQEGVRWVYIRLNHGPLDVALAPIRLLRSTLQFKPDVIHLFKPKAFAGAAGWLLWHLKRLGLSIPLVVDEDDWEGPGGWNDILPYPKAAKMIFAWQERWGLRHADAVTVASRTLESLTWALGMPPKRVHYLPNGAREYPPGDGTRVRAQYGVQDHPLVLLYTRFYEYDTAQVAEAFRRIHAACPDARLLIVGKGLFPADEKRLVHQLAACGLKEYTLWAGWVKTENLSDYFAAADIAIYPFTDTLINRTKCPVKLVELLANGVPVVADAVGEIREYIRHNETGLLVPSGSPVAMAEAVIALLQAPEKRRALGQAAAATMRTTFAWRTLAKRLFAVYESLNPN